MAVAVDVRACPRPGENPSWPGDGDRTGRAADGLGPRSHNLLRSSRPGCVASAANTTQQETACRRGPRRRRSPRQQGRPRRRPRRPARPGEASRLMRDLLNRRRAAAWARRYRSSTTGRTGCRSRSSLRRRAAASEASGVRRRSDAIRLTPHLGGHETRSARVPPPPARIDRTRTDAGRPTSRADPERCTSPPPCRRRAPQAASRPLPR